MHRAGRRARPVTAVALITMVAFAAGCGMGRGRIPIAVPASGPGTAVPAGPDSPVIAAVPPAHPSATPFDDPWEYPGEESRVNIGGDTHPLIPQDPFGIIEIPRIGLIHPIYEGVDLPNLHWGPGHWPGSALPGQIGNAVFAGHRVTHTRPFLDIDQLATGDQIIFTTKDGRFVYEVTGHQIVAADDVEIVDPTLSPTVTVSACHPKGSARQRYVVRGRLLGQT